MKRALVTLVLLAACNGEDVRPPVPTPELVRELAGAEAELQRGARDDYWTERFGDYMEARELRAYWSTPPEERFQAFGLRLLEFRLREELLQANRLKLTLEQVEAYRSQPDYDQARAYLQRTLGDELENP